MCLMQKYQIFQKKWKKKWDKHPLYQFCSQAHGREMTSEQYAKVCDPKSFEPYSVKMLKNLKEEYDKFRKTPGQERLSFEDMIDNFLFYGKEPEDIQVLMVDEAQDCSRPQRAEDPHRTYARHCAATTRE